MLFDNPDNSMKMKVCTVSTKKYKIMVIPRGPPKRGARSICYKCYVGNPALLTGGGGIQDPEVLYPPMIKKRSGTRTLNCGATVAPVLSHSPSNMPCSKVYGAELPSWMG